MPGSAEHQSLLHFVGQSEWDEKALLRAVLPVMTERHPIEAWIVDDTGFPKKGVHSVGVARQYCGQLGKKENCHVAVSLSLATSEASLPVAWQLYLPLAWAEDAPRREKAKVPETIGFQTKPEIAPRKPLRRPLTAHRGHRPTKTTKLLTMPNWGALVVLRLGHIVGTVSLLALSACESGPIGDFRAASIRDCYSRPPPSVTTPVIAQVQE